MHEPLGIEHQTKRKARKMETVMPVNQYCSTGMEALAQTIRNLYRASDPNILGFAAVLDNIHNNIKQEMAQACNCNQTKESK